MSKKQDGIKIREKISELLETAKRPVSTIEIRLELEKRYNIQKSTNSIAGNLGILLRENKDVKCVHVIQRFILVQGKNFGEAYPVYESYWYKISKFSYKEIQNFRLKRRASSQTKVWRKPQKQLEFEFMKENKE